MNLFDTLEDLFFIANHVEIVQQENSAAATLQGEKELT